MTMNSSKSTFGSVGFRLLILFLPDSFSLRRTVAIDIDCDLSSGPVTLSSIVFSQLSSYRLVTFGLALPGLTLLEISGLALS